MYHSIAQRLLFKLDPEQAHELVMRGGEVASFPPAHALLRKFFSVEDKRLAVTVAGITFDNPIGLAAGMDKRGSNVHCFDAMGFGAVEIGTVTAVPQPGNPKPRIFRLLNDRALINRMGFPSEGADHAVRRLSELNRSNLRAKIGINIGKSKVTPLEAAREDYLSSFRKLLPFGDYFVFNVSSPNTPELRKLQEKGRLAELFSGVREENRLNKPVFVKVAPDLTSSELDDIVTVVIESGLAGIVATNTTINRDGLSATIQEAGGLSGEPLKLRARDVVRYLYSQLKGRLPIIGVGGISSGADVVEMMRAGASAVQLYTGLVYSGPGLVKKIKRELIQQLDREGVAQLVQLVRQG